MRQLLSIKYLSILCLVLSSCAGLKGNSYEQQQAESGCNHHDIYSYTAEELPTPLHELELNDALTSQFNHTQLNTANTIGILDKLEAYALALDAQKQDSSFEAKIEALELSQEINHQINFASISVSAIASELDCEEERADQIAAYLKAKEDNTEKKLTVAAIVVGATGAVLTSAFLNRGATPEYIGISTAFTEAVLGVLILLNKRSVNFHHPRNHLKDIWEGPEVSAYFPPSIWYYINYQNPNEETDGSVQSKVVEQWKGFGQLGDEDEYADQISLFFGDGGKYDAEELKQRADMLDQLGAQISLMKQDLKNLTLAIQDMK